MMRSFKVCAFYRILLDLLHQEDVIDGAGSMYGDKKKHKILVRKVCGRDFELPRCNWEDNVIVYCRKKGCEVVNRLKVGCCGMLLH
jgi:hypothetical protein